MLSKVSVTLDVLTVYRRADTYGEGVGPLFAHTLAAVANFEFLIRLFLLISFDCVRNMGRTDINTRKR